MTLQYSNAFDGILFSLSVLKFLFNTFYIPAEVKGVACCLLSGFYMLSELWICLFLLYSVTDFAAFVQSHFTGSLSVVGEAAFSHIHCFLPNVSEETRMLFILWDYAHTSRTGGAFEFLAVIWNRLCLPYTEAWSVHASTFLHVLFYTEKKGGFCSQRETKQIIICWIKFPDYLQNDAGIISAVKTFPSLPSLIYVTNPHILCDFHAKCQFFHILS